MTFTNAEAEAVTAETGKVILIDEYLADSDSMAYELDRTDAMWSLADDVEKGIEVLDNGFFMMCEGGKIDWACHANDAAVFLAPRAGILRAEDGVTAAVTPSRLPEGACQGLR